MVIKRNILGLIFIQFTIMFFVMKAFGSFNGPLLITEGGWGSDLNEFGFMSGDTSDSFPGGIRVNTLGNIFLVDGVNRCVKIYNLDGNLISKIEPHNIVVPFGWPAFMECDSKNNIYTSNYDKKLQKYNIKGELLWEKEVFVGSIKVMPDDSIIISGYREDKKGTEKYLHFNSSGNIIKTYYKKPLELGEVKERSLSGSRFKVTIKYPDKIYTLNKGPYSDYLSGCDGILYAMAGKLIEKYNTFGDSIGKLIIPKDQIKEIFPGGRGMEAVAELICEYGQPIVALNGDVYTWKRTPDKYSILKWIWVDGPDSPQYLTIESSKIGIKLSWKAPVQDSESVTNYEIFRSTNVCGPFEKIDTVTKKYLTYEDKSVSNEITYYYKIRAVRSKIFSGYSNKVIGKIE